MLLNRCYADGGCKSATLKLGKGFARESAGLIIIQVGLCLWEGGEKGEVSQTKDGKGRIVLKVSKPISRKCSPHRAVLI